MLSYFYEDRQLWKGVIFLPLIQLGLRQAYVILIFCAVCCIHWYHILSTLHVVNKYSFDRSNYTVSVRFSGGMAVYMAFHPILVVFFRILSTLHVVNKYSFERSNYTASVRLSGGMAVYMAFHPILVVFL